MSKRIDRVDVREGLKPQRDPHWLTITEGQAIGFRKMSRGSKGTFLGRMWNPDKPASATSKSQEPGGYDQRPLGDFADLPEKERYPAAKGVFDAWAKHLGMGGTTVGGSVRMACEAYVAHLGLENSPAAATDAEGRFGRLIYNDPIARVELTKLVPRHCADWKLRVMEGGSTRMSFNRNAMPLRAAMNLAYSRGQVASDHAWRKELRPFKGVDGRRELYLTRTERKALLENATPEAQRFIRSLMLVPFRPGDVAKLKVEHFDPRLRSLKVPAGKTAEREIPLSNEACAHFAACAKDKLPGAWLVARDKGTPWPKDRWRIAICDAAAAAKLPRATCAYTLRHCVITDLVTGGLDLFTVAKLSGTSVSMIEKSYGKLRQEHAREALEKLALG